VSRELGYSIAPGLDDEYPLRLVHTFSCFLCWGSGLVRVRYRADGEDKQTSRTCYECRGEGTRGTSSGLTREDGVRLRDALTAALEAPPVATVEADPVRELALGVGLNADDAEAARLARFACVCAPPLDGTPVVGVEDDEGIEWCSDCGRPMLAATVHTLAHEYAGREDDGDAALIYQGGLRRLWRELQGAACKAGACVVGDPRDGG